jgi:protein involved in polysaccharide export with SLBB domain
LLTRPSQSLLALALASLATLNACVREVRPPELPLPEQSTTLGVGDELEIRIAGAKDFPTSYQLAPDGSVNLPYVGPVSIVGLEPHEIEGRIRKTLMDAEIFTNPNVSVVVRAYRSKRVSILGQVKKPDSYALEPGMTLLRLISLCGGFTDIADEGAVSLRRQLSGGKVKIVTIDVDQIIANRIADVPLQAGDSINVPRSTL